MPGILPMKVIKVGSSSQSRIAQACDRCRSKKIRCDGVRPSCTQCMNVGFECKTSDKLSRRAFPRGYTESLEERVRCLEAEVRELKDLLDEKDEKIDMLSRIHSHSPQAPHMSSRSAGTDGLSRTSSHSPTSDRDDTFKVNQSSIPVRGSNSVSYFLGTSSPRSLIDTFRSQIRELGEASIDERADALLHGESRDLAAVDTLRVRWRAPPRMLSDQLVNVFFQEWAPLYPVLHRPAFLQLYEDYVSSPESMTNKHSLAQLHLVFGIASQSSQSRDDAELASIESQWRAAVDAIASIDSIATLQCLVLAQIYSLIAADYSALLRYKSLSVALSQRLGLHHSQKALTLNTLDCQTRKRVFWTLYALDCFSAAQLGLPRHFNDEDIQCEYPVDADDEYVTDKGFLPTLPGESTKISSALALFRAARVLAAVLKELYPSSSPHEVSFKTIASLTEDLDAWLKGLPAHLRLHFTQDKPSTNVVTSRSPLLSLAYQYILAAIHRPALHASHALGDRASSSIVAVATAAKRSIQIVQLLDERNLSFSMCVNRNELLISSGFALLSQGLGLDKDGKLMKDNQRMISTVDNLVEAGRAIGSRNFRRTVRAVMGSRGQQLQPPPLLSRNSSESVSSATSEALRNTQKQLKALAARFSPNRHQCDGAGQNDRRSVLPIATAHANGSQGSVSSVHSEPAFIAPKSRPSKSPQATSMSPPRPPRSSHSSATPNLDYLPLGSGPPKTNAQTSKNGVRPRQSLPQIAPAPSKSSSELASAEWEQLIGTLDQGETNIYDSIYGGPPVSVLEDADFSPTSLAVPLSADAIEAQNLVWDSTGAAKLRKDAWRHSFDDLTASAHEWDSYPLLPGPTRVPRSVLSFSDESLTSGEDFASVKSSLRSGSLSTRLTEGEEADLFRGLMIPADSVSPQSLNSLGDELGVLDAGFGL